MANDIAVNKVEMGPGSDAPKSAETPAVEVKNGKAVPVKAAEPGVQAQGKKEKEEVKKDEPKKKTTEEIAAAAKRLAQAAKKEAEATKKLAEAQEREKKAASFEEIAALAKKDKKAFLEKFGLSFKDIAADVIKNGEPKQKTEVDTLREAVEQLTKQFQESEEQRKKLLADSERANIGEATKQYQAKMKEVITSKPDEFELVIANEAFDEVWSVIEGHYEKTQKALKFEEAAKLVEDELFNQAQKLLATKKASALMKGNKKEKDVTLTSEATSSAANAIESSIAGRELSDWERVREAAKLLKYN